MTFKTGSGSRVTDERIAGRYVEAWITGRVLLTWAGDRIRRG